MREVLRWIDRHNGAPALEILASSAGGDAPATDLLAGIVATDSREQSGIWSTTSGVLAAYRTEGALASTTRRSARPPGVLRRTQHALRVLDRSAPTPIRAARGGDHRGRARRGLRPVPRRAHRPAPRSSRSTRSPTSPPSPTSRPWSAKARARGSLVLACLQDLSQARGRWGRAADGFLSLFGTTVVLRGIADTATLRDISALAGDREVATTTVSRSVDRWGRIRPSTSVGSTRHVRLPVDAVAHGTPGPRARPRPGQGGARGLAHARTRTVALARAAAAGPAARRPRARRPRPRPLSQRPRPRSVVTGSRHPSRARAAAICRSVRT